MDLKAEENSDNTKISVEKKLFYPKKWKNFQIYLLFSVSALGKLK